MDSEDKSITSGGINIPNWMKQKIGDRYDLDDSAFSPPSQDDSFFYIRYPKTTSRAPADTNYHKINTYLESQAATVASSSSSTVPVGSTAATSMVPVVPSVKPSEHPPPMQFQPLELPDSAEAQPELHHRRGSKSLPASPLNSPKQGRKLMTSQQHRYFTAAFPQPTKEQGYTGWLLGSLLVPRESEQNLSTISESTSAGTAEENSSLRKSVSAAMLHPADTAEGPPPRKPIIKPRPSEMREMNFWSPTSM